MTLNKVIHLVKAFFSKDPVVVHELSIDDKLKLKSYVNNEGVYTLIDFRFMYYNYVYTQFRERKRSICPYVNYLKEVFSNSPNLKLKYKYRLQVIQSKI